MRNAVDGINVLNAAINRLTEDQPTPTLTNLHAPLLALFIKADRFKDALPFLRFRPETLFDDSYQPVRQRGMRVHVLEAQRARGMTTGNYVQTFNQVVNQTLPQDGRVPPAGGGGTGRESTQGLLKCKPVLLYFLYGAMIYAALERYDDALHLLEHIFNLPATRPSAIVMEGVRKYVLISLIVGRPEPSATLSNLPRAFVMARGILPNVALYTGLENVYQKAIVYTPEKSLADSVVDYVRRNYALFAQDNNIGLVKRLVVACKERAVQRLPKIFMSIKEADLARHAHMPLDQAKKVMQRMVDRGELQVRASGEKADRILHFDEPPMPAASDVAKCHEELDAALKRMMRLGNAIKHFDTAVSHNLIYMERSKRMGTGPMDGGGEGGANGDGMHNDGEDFGTATPME